MGNKGYPVTFLYKECLRLIGPEGLLMLYNPLNERIAKGTDATVY